jgi:hypothetical protein
MPSKKSSKGSSGSSSGSSEKEALQALERIGRAVERFESSRADTESLDLRQACKVYNQIKPFLKTALPLIERIPIYGSKIAAAIRTLMQIADTVCPA